MELRVRSIPSAIIFSIITCGIYGIYWFVCVVTEVREATKDEELPTGGIAVLLSLITFGIYAIYLYYKMAKSMFNAKLSDDNAILYIILAIFGFSIVNWCLIQSDLNRLAESNSKK